MIETDPPLDDFEALGHAPRGSTVVLTPTGLALRTPEGAIVPIDELIDGPSEPVEAPRSEPEPQSTPPSTLEQLRALPGVRSAMPIGDGTYAVALDDPDALDGLPFEVEDDRFFATAADPYEAYQWSLENDGQAMVQIGERPTLDADMDAAVAAQHAAGRGVVVAVVDSGVDFTHPDLADARWTNPDDDCGNGIDDDGNGYVDDCHGWDFAYADNEPYNAGLSPHGTHVAGTIAARRNGQGVVGVAPEATIMDLNVGLATSGGMTLPGSAITAAVRYAVDNGADVVNLSLGSDPGAPRDGLAGLEQALDHAAANGVVVVVAAGNHNVRLDQTPVWPASFDKPNQLTVAASTSSDGKAGFSNYGGPIDLWAPGQNVLATMPGGGFAFMSGTSMASPNVAGAVAVLLSSEPAQTPAEVIRRLEDTSDRFDVLAAHGGAGRRLNAGEALGGALVDPDRVITELAVAATGLGGASTDRPVSTTVRFEVPDGAFGEDYHWEMLLLADTPDGLWALVDHPVTVDEAVRSTGETAAIDLGVTGTSEVTITTTLAAGDYGLVFEAVPTDDPGSRLGEPFVLRFTVTEAPDGTEPTPGPAASATTPGSAPAPGTTPDAAPAPTPGPGANPTPSPAPTGSAPSTPTAGDPAPVTAGSTPGGTSPGAPSTPGVAPTPGSPQPAPSPGSGSTAPTPAPDPAPSAPSGGPAPVTSPPAPSPAAPDPTPTPTSLGSFSSSQVTPHVGPVGQTTAVTLTGTFPDPVRVYFGATEATSVVQTANRIETRAPARSVPGPVDIRLVRNGTTVLTIADGFTYGAPARSTPSPSPAAAPPVAPERPDATPTPPVAPPTGSPATPTPDRPTDQPVTGGDSTEAVTDGAGRTGRGRVPRAPLVGDRTALDGGLSGVRYDDPDRLGASPPCRSNTCRTTGA